MNTLLLVREMLTERGFTIDPPKNGYLYIGQPSHKLSVGVYGSHLHVLNLYTSVVVWFELSDPHFLEKLINHYNHG